MLHNHVSIFVLFVVLQPVLCKDLYSNQFVLHIDGDAGYAKEVAQKHGFEYLGEVFDGHHHIRSDRIHRRSLDDLSSLHPIRNESNVISLKHQRVRRRVKRISLPYPPSFHSNSHPSEYPLNDPKWPQMWYLNRGGGLDMNVVPVWEMGVAGRGVVVTILDDGLEKDHPDIRENYDPGASWDMNNHDPDPAPRYDMSDSNRHGTRCAGEVAATRNNSVCAVGIAYHAKIGGVRMLDGDVTDVVEARSLSLNNQHIDIYSASWGPDDDGKTVDGPGELATRAFKEGIEKGRNGLGSIFVWASGNGGREKDNCNCDGYVNSIWTLSISSATENGMVPWYSEACASTLATTYSSGSSNERQIVTSDLHNGCTTSHTGTSASAPLAAGIIALALEANRNLTWRDMQHIVVRSAKRANLKSPDWVENGVGRNVSHSFGFGLMDAHAMVRLAKRWRRAPQQQVCTVRAQPMDKLIPAKSHVQLKLGVHCSNVRFLEHVQAKVTLSATRRGDIHIYLTSPMGTQSTLLAMRPMDNSRAGFQAWPFMTVHNWGEDPDGDWTLDIHNDGSYAGKAHLKAWSLVLYGTNEDPETSILVEPLGQNPAPDISSNSLASRSGSLPDNRVPITSNSRPGGSNNPSPPVYKSMPPPPQLNAPDAANHIQSGIGRRPALKRSHRT